MRSLAARFSLLPLIVALAVSGCSKPPPPVPTASVVGTVTLDGKPLPEATVVFAPADAAQPGGAASAQVRNGSYSATVPHGQFRVTFATAAPTAGSASSDVRATKAVSLPESARQGQPVEITGDNSKLDFVLKSR